jgi:hypothetical protein
MTTPITSNPFSAHRSMGGSTDPETLSTAPAVVVAGSRVTREMVRLFVAGAFCIVETVLRLDEWRFVQALHRRKRRA